MKWSENSLSFLFWRPCRKMSITHSYFLFLFWIWSCRAVHRKRRHHHSKFAGSGSPAVEVGAHLVAKRESSRKEESSLEQPRRLLRRPRRNFLLLPLLRVPPANLTEKIQQLCHVLHTTQPPSRLWRPSQPAKLRLLPTNTRQVFWSPGLLVCLSAWLACQKPQHQGLM